MSLAIFFSFYVKVSEAGMIRMNHTCLCLGLPISRQPLENYGGQDYNLLRLMAKSDRFQLKNRSRKPIKTPVLQITTVMGG